MPSHYAAVRILEGGFVHSQELFEALYHRLIHIYALYKVIFWFCSAIKERRWSSVLGIVTRLWAGQSGIQILV